METITTILVLLLLIALMAIFVGLIRPSLVIRWGEKRTRGRVILYYGVGAIALAIMGSQTDPEIREKQKQTRLEQAQKNLERGTNLLSVARMAYNSQDYQTAIDSADVAISTLKSAKLLNEATGLVDLAQAFLDSVNAAVELERKQAQIAEARQDSIKRVERAREQAKQDSIDRVRLEAKKRTEAKIKAKAREAETRKDSIRRVLESGGKLQVWMYNSVKDKLTDEVKHVATQYGEFQDERSESMEIICGKIEGKKTIWLRIQTEEIINLKTGFHPVQWRVDTRKAISEKWLKGGEYLIKLQPNQSMLNALMNGENFLIRVSYYSPYDFSLVGGQKHIAKVIEACSF